MSVYRFNHPTLGEVTAVGRPGSRKLSGRWVKGRLRVNLPDGLTARDIEAAVSRHAADFERIRPLPRYGAGTVITIPGPSQTNEIEIRIERSPVSRITAGAQTDPSGNLRFTIMIPPDVDMADPDVQRRISAGLEIIGKRLAPQLLLPRARQLAGQFGLTVDRWEIAHGKNVLGTCYPSSRRIRLSWVNVYLPRELRDYIICHELAHLTEPGHTPAFHRLCDRYLAGQESRLIRLLHSYRWPIER